MKENNRTQHKLLRLLKSKEHEFWTLVHTMGLTALLLIVGIIPFFNPEEKTPLTIIIRFLAPILQIVVLLTGIKVMGVFSTVSEYKSEKPNCKEIISRQLISKKDFRIIVVASTITTVFIGLYIMITIGDNSGISIQLLLNIISVFIGIMITPDEVFEGKTKRIENSPEDETSSGKSTPYDTLSTSIIVMALMLGIVLIDVTKDITGLSHMRTKIIAILAITAILIAYFITNNNNKKM